MSCVCVCVCVCLCVYVCVNTVHLRVVYSPTTEAFLIQIISICVCFVFVCIYTVHLTIPCSLTSRTFGVQMVCVYIALRLQRAQSTNLPTEYTTYSGKNIHSESHQFRADMNEIKYKIYKEINNIHISFVVMITINCII